MDYDASVEIWRRIRETTLSDLREDLVNLAVRYARMRADYGLAGAERRGDLEIDRTACHNALIASCDILARNMAKHGEDAGWREQLGDDRKIVGDFACYLHAILGVLAR